MEHESFYEGHTIRVTAQQITPSTTSPRIVRVSLWIDGQRIEPSVNSDFPPSSFVGQQEEDGISYALEAAKRIIDKRKKE